MNERDAAKPTGPTSESELLFELVAIQRTHQSLMLATLNRIRRLMAWMFFILVIGMLVIIVLTWMSWTNMAILLNINHFMGLPGA